MIPSPFPSPFPSPSQSPSQSRSMTDSLKTPLENIQIEDFLDVVTDAVMMADREQKIVFFNQSAETLFGFSASEILGHTFDRLIPERFQASHTQYFEKFLASPDGKRVMKGRTEVIARRRDGSEFPIEANIGKFHSGGEILFVIFLRDITERKRAERDLEQWAKAFEHAEWGVVVGEASTRSLQVMNPAFARMYGYTIEELSGKPIETVYAPSERAKLESWIHKAHEAGHITYESRHIRRDQAEFPVMVNITAVKDPQGTALYRVVNVTDLSEFKKTKQALQEIEQQNTRIIEALYEGILLLDHQGHVLMCNASAEKILAISKDQISGQSIFNSDWKVFNEDGSLSSPDEFPAQITLATGKVCKDKVLGISRPDGSIQWVSVSTHPLHQIAEHNPYSVLVSFVDITERVQMYRLMEERVKESTRELSALLEVSRTLVSTLDLPSLLKAILVQLKQVVDYTGAAIARLDGDAFSILEYLGPVPREIMLNFRISNKDDTGYRRVMLSRKPYIIQDMWENNPWLKTLQTQTDAQLAEALKPAHSWIGVPMITQNQIVGILRLDHLQPNYFKEHHVKLITTFAELAAIAIQNADQFEQTQLLAALKERQKLARELHDSVSQVLYGIDLGVRTARELLGRQPEKAIEPLDYCVNLAETGLAEMRALIFELRPESLEKEGLVNALTKQITALKARYQLVIATNFCPEPSVPIAVKETVYRIAQEALHNVVKHARAQKIDIHLAACDGNMVLEVKDNGQGFDPGLEKTGHMGLVSMRERAQRIGASLTIESEVGKGTLVRLELPAPPH
jgi:PAS domain S-box-containing protein